MSSTNSDAIDAVTEGINRVGVLDSEVQVCANCGKEGGDVTNTCNKCKTVMYCNAACKKKHRHKHKKECEEYLLRAAERAAKLHDEQLFEQPPPGEDCHICFLRLPNLGTGRTYLVCCGKHICSGCMHTFQSGAAKEEDYVCPFCRSPLSISDEEMIKRFEKRIELNDENAIYNFGCLYFRGEFGLPRNYAKALKLWHRAGELGRASAYCGIGNLYNNGGGVERDKKKATHYYELAAMGGDVDARHNLGNIEVLKGNHHRAIKHYMIGARDGDSLNSIKRLYLMGYATKDNYEKALRSYQAYLDEIKSDQRDEAAADGDAKYYESAI